MSLFTKKVLSSNNSIVIHNFLVGGLLVEGPIEKTAKEVVGKATKLHQIVEDFNENEIINNPKWGTAPFVENQGVKGGVLPVTKKIGSPGFEKERGIKLRERGKLTAGNFFPRIGSPSLNLINKWNNNNINK